MSFTDYHERGFRILASNFLRGFLHEHEVELQHLLLNMLLHLIGFIVVCEGFLGIEPFKGLFRRIFEIHSRKVDTDNAELAPLGGLTIQIQGTFIN